LLTNVPASDLLSKQIFGTYDKLTKTCFLTVLGASQVRVNQYLSLPVQSTAFGNMFLMTQRISMRFQEYNIQQNEVLAAKAESFSQP
uniref:Uncharacterized protein n=1 Tax=Monodelphis domestica TaxID=13616 RepID=A0A5F8HIQ2_MONDO